MTRSLSLVLLAVGLFQSCSSTALVRVLGPEGTRVSIGNHQAQFVPFDMRMSGRQRVMIKVDQEVMKNLGLSRQEIDKVIQNETSILEGTVEVRNTPDLVELKLEDESLKRAMLNYARFSWKYWDTRKRTVLTFNGRARMKK